MSAAFGRARVMLSNRLSVALDRGPDGGDSDDLQKPPGASLCIAASCGAAESFFAEI